MSALNVMDSGCPFEAGSSGWWPDSRPDRWSRSEGALPLHVVEQRRELACSRNTQLLVGALPIGDHAGAADIQIQRCAFDRLADDRASANLAFTGAQRGRSYLQQSFDALDVQMARRTAPLVHEDLMLLRGDQEQFRQRRKVAHLGGRESAHPRPAECAQ